ncbi:family 2A encapsulin nanocompartment cargo protein cysteine desulfurase [Hylemonella gracilis]|uniref:cysteine desulfurase n=1 Tax=Hylemonella gracilis ATCC 19624 TaxID=887062 RepID=F3KSX4_9BURK|nr:family 2A encapsulin nanocompartment cargo protein cysteine desulfurase [Hylemonella gracilis]EGI77193.1 putative cysteine desulfurase [Hylemonella gracilis ATCC 19624]
MNATRTPAPSLSGASLPPGLPDPAAFTHTLTQWAGELFAALPTAAGSAAPTPPTGGVPVAGTPQPAGLSLPSVLTSGPSTPTATAEPGPPPGLNVAPQSPQALASGLASAPALVPHAQAGHGVPDHAVQAAPGYDGRLGSGVLSVPQAPAAYSADIPHVAPSQAGGGSPVHGIASGYYFLGESQDRAPAPAVPSGTADDRVSARSWGLPGDEALRALLADPGRRDGVPGGANAPAPGFYFLDHAFPDAASARNAPHSAAGPQTDSEASLAQRNAVAHPPFDVHAVRRDFPILQERVNGKQIVWFDNAATTQKPQAVIDRLAYFYAHENSNIHRAAHALAARATDAYEDARETVRRFLNASSTEEIIFVRGTTEAINLVAKSWGAKHIGPGDEIIVSHLEHHANIVPWQQLASEKGARLRVIPVDEDGQVLLGEYQKLLSDKTKIVAVTQVSNALGTVTPIKEIVELAHRAGAKALVDGAQSVSHMKVDVQALDADFLVFSGHKIFGPTGIGVVYGKRAILEDTPPWQGGGNMIADVTFERTVFQPPPAKFEAGTGNIADAVGLGAALEYVERIGIENIGRYEHALLEYATQHLRPIPGVRLVGTARDKASVLSFVLEGYSTEEVGKALNAEGIAVRTGHHCAQPILRRFGLETTVRPSLAFYNTCEEVDRFIAVIRRLAAARPTQARGR